MLSLIFLISYRWFLEILWEIWLWIDLCTPNTFAGLKNLIGLGLGFLSFKISWIILLKRDVNIFVTLRYVGTSKNYMRYMYLTQVFLYTSYNLKCSHRFCESKTWGWIKFTKERCLIGNPSIYFYHETKITWKVGGENH